MGAGISQDEMDGGTGRWSIIRDGHEEQDHVQYETKKQRINCISQLKTTLLQPPVHHMTAISVSALFLKCFTPTADNKIRINVNENSNSTYFQFRSVEMTSCNNVILLNNFNTTVGLNPRCFRILTTPLTPAL